MSSSVHIDNENKGTLIVDKGPTQGLDDTTIKTEGGYSINFSRSQKKKKKCSSLHYQWINSFLFVNTTKIYIPRQKILK